MSRKEFLKILRKRLSFLDKDTLEKEVLYYINKIDSSKKSDKEVIESFGGLDEIVKSVCKKNNIDYKKIQDNKGWFKEFYNALVD